MQATSGATNVAEGTRRVLGRKTKRSYGFRGQGQIRFSVRSGARLRGYLVEIFAGRTVGTEAADFGTECGPHSASLGIGTGGESARDLRRGHEGTRQRSRT